MKRPPLPALPDKVPGCWIILITVILAFLPVLQAFPQEYEVSEPRLELDGDVLHIYYDILRSQTGEKFDISIEVEDEKGNLIPAHTLKGDVGSGVAGGTNKHIVWEFEKDGVFLDAEIYIKVYARLASRAVKQANAEKQREETGSGRVTPADASSPGRAGLMLQSVALPGLGLTKVTGKPHWIKGVVGYGCIAGSVVLNRRAITAFDSIGESDSNADAEDAFNQAVRLDNTSEILAYAAIGIWVTDLVWTLVGTSSRNMSSMHIHRKGLNLTADVDQMTRIPRIGIIYKF